MNIYDSAIEAAQLLPATQRGQLYAAMIEYLYFDRREPEFRMAPAARAVFVAIRPNLDNQLDNAERGRRGGRPRKGRADVAAADVPHAMDAAADGPIADATEKAPVSDSGNSAESQTKAGLSQNGNPTESQTKAGLFDLDPENQNPTESEQEQEQDIKPKKEKQKDADPAVADARRQVVAHLNEATGSRYRANAEATRKVVEARLREGFSAADLMAVVDHKAAQWLADERMRGYLRPETLFRASKFEGYLNEARLAASQGGAARNAEYVRG